MNARSLSSMALLSSAVAIAGCAGGSASSGTCGAGGAGHGGTPGTGQGGGAATTSSAASGSGGAGGISGGGTGFTTPHQMFDWVNQTRTQYQGHIPYDGYPFQGMNANLMTWTPLMTWDDGLATEAQAEVEKIAAGTQQPQGMYYPFQNEPGEGFWVTGLETNRYKLSAKSDAHTPAGKDPFGNPKPPNKWQSTANGFYRMAVAYQTGTGQFNHKSKLGVGAAEGGDQITWWVLVFSE